MKTQSHGPARRAPRAANSPAMMTVFARVAQERLRQRELLFAGALRFDCASPVVDENRKLRVLVEEVGEVANALDKLESPSAPARVFAREELVEELTQVAAVAVAWLESLEGQP